MVLLIAVSIFLKNLPPESFTNSIGMEFVEIPSGKFQIGSPPSEVGRDGDEGPQQWVTFSQPFYLGKYEVTQREWLEVMGGKNPSSFSEVANYLDLPVEQVSWDECWEFLTALNAREDGYTYRLPSEAEWEYACRAGKTEAYAGKLNDLVWDMSNSGNVTSPVRRGNPNGWGLYHMHGNVSEWCQDWYHDSYEGIPKDGRAWESPVHKDQYRVLRGGSYGSPATSCRSASRVGNPTKYNKESPKEHKSQSNGFRVVAEKTSAP